MAWVKMENDFKGLNQKGKGYTRLSLQFLIQWKDHFGEHLVIFEPILNFTPLQIVFKINAKMGFRWNTKSLKVREVPIPEYLLIANIIGLR